MLCGTLRLATLRSNDAFWQTRGCAVCGQPFPGGWRCDRWFGGISDNRSLLLLLDPSTTPSDNAGSFCLQLCRSTDPVAQANKGQDPPRSAYDYLTWFHPTFCSRRDQLRRQRRPWRLVRTTPIKGIPRSSRKVPCTGGGYRPLIRLGLKRAAVLFSARSMS